jgi:hypothetical protein
MNPDSQPARDERRWTLYEHAEMAGTAMPIDCYRGPKHPEDAEGVEVMPVATHEADWDEREAEWVRQARIYEARIAAAEAALTAARQVDEAMVKRAAEVISHQLDGGYRGHWCAEWWDEQEVCKRCREIAHAALLAALNPEGEAMTERTEQSETE